MRNGGRLALGLAMFALAAATPLSCGEPFALTAGPDGGGGKDGGTKSDAGDADGSGGSGGGGPLVCEMPTASQIYGDCHVVHKCTDGTTVTDAAPTDIYDDGNPCTADSCGADGTPLNQVTLRASCSGPAPAVMCDAKGACVQCVVDMDCVAPAICEAGKCAPSLCRSKAQDPNETDIDCGGPCKPCADGLHCNGFKDCVSLVCDIGNKMCTPPTCKDNVKNGQETDRDCGGTCGPCDVGYVCKLGTDCKSGVCKVGSCQPSSCTDGVKNGMETGVDCGGPDCGACMLP